MSEGNELGEALRALERLSAELGYESTEERLDADDVPLLVGVPRSILVNLSAEDEALVGAVRRSLARLAAAIDRESRDGAQVGAVLDGIELVMRAELARGRAAQLTGMLPGFVSLVALALVDQDEAIEVSQRAAQLIDGSPKD